MITPLKNKKTAVAALLLAFILSFVIMFNPFFIPKAFAASFYVNWYGNGGTLSKTGGTYSDSAYGYWEQSDFPTGSRSGYILQGFSTSPDGPVNIYVGLKRDGVRDRFLYAIWLAVYTVTFDPNGGELTTGETFVSVTDGTLFSDVDKPGLTRPGYTFSGWQNAPGTVTENITVIALWEVIYFTITFDPAGGNISEGSAVQTVAMYSDAIPPTVSRDGYVLSQWDGSYSNVTENRTVTAIWLKLDDNKKVVTVNYDTGGADGQVKTTEKLYAGIAYGELQLPVVTRDGYTFAGWYLGNVKIENLQNTEITEDVTITARWEINKPPELNFFQRLWRWILNLFGLDI